MAPQKRRWTRRNICKTVAKEVSTQTEKNETNAKERKLVVVLEKNNLEQFNAENNKEKDDAPSPESENVTQRNSAIGIQVPNYTVFARPITNNDKANSTLLLDKNKVKLKPRKVTFERPGPLCSKKKKITEEDLTIPAMLSAIPDNSLQNNLESIIEKSVEDTETPELQSDSLIEPDLREAAVQINNDIFENDQVATNINQIESSSPTHEGPSDNRIPENIRFHFGGITTVISTRSDENGDDKSNDDSDSSNGNDHETGGKYIKIKATTVHIHNHFYKS